MSLACRLPTVLGLIVTVAVCAVPSPAQARRNGYFGNCVQCHKDGSDAQLSVSFTPDQFEPGALVRVTVTIASPSASVGGFFLNASGVGELIPLGGDVRVTGTQATHTNPKNASNGSIVFELDWQAPSQPRGAHFTAYGVGANGNNNPGGDSAATPLYVDRIFGCEGAMFYRDFDGDGYGTTLVPPLLDCTAPVGYAANAGDCSEDDAMLNPGNEEICNGVDDDCDERVDEFAAPTCGIGMCMRYASYCDANAPCYPGDPMPEMCNGLDDDCDGVVDQGELCLGQSGMGQGDLVCHQAVCKTLDEALAIDPTFVPFEGSDPPATPIEPPAGGVTGMGGTIAAGGMPGAVPSAPVAQGGSGGSSAPLSGGAATTPEPPQASEATCAVAPRARSDHSPGLMLISVALASCRARRRRGVTNT